MEDLTKHYLISGRVQGVGFRMFVYRTAVELGLRGWVRNLADGRVEAWARGSVAAIKKFEDELKSGPPRARVESITVSVREGNQAAADFAVKEDGEQPCSDGS